MSSIKHDVPIPSVEERTNFLNSPRCGCKKGKGGVLVTKVSEDGKYTDTECTKCGRGWHYPNFQSNNFPWLNPGYIPITIIPNPNYVYRDRDEDSSLCERFEEPDLDEEKEAGKNKGKDDDRYTFPYR